MAVALIVEGSRHLIGTNIALLAKTTGVVAGEIVFYALLHLLISKHFRRVNPWLGAILAVTPVALVFILGGAHHGEVVATVEQTVDYDRHKEGQDRNVALPLDEPHGVCSDKGLVIGSDTHVDAEYSVVWMSGQEGRSSWEREECGCRKCGWLRLRA